jgi:hypothetical protein
MPMKCCRVCLLGIAGALALLGWTAVALADTEDEIHGWAVEDTIYVVHEQAYYNCCAVIEADMELPEPFVVDFLERETYPVGPCYCMCYIDVTMWGASFQPGLYLARVWNQDRTILFGTTEVEVLGPGAGPPAFWSCLQSDCYGTSSVDEENPEPALSEESTWGRIKGLYR